jgi:hypothetical protein
MDDEMMNIDVLYLTEDDARRKAATLRIKHQTGNIMAEKEKDGWVIAKYENNKRYVMTKPVWTVKR